MAAELEVLNPVAQLAAELGEPPPTPLRPRTLEGASVGLYRNRKPGGNFALDRVGERLQQHYPGLETSFYHGRRPISEDLIREIKDSHNVVVGATAD